MSNLDCASRLAALEPRCTTAEALAFFDQLPAVSSAEIRGRWKGRELATGHRFDGALVASGFYGKKFDNQESVHPLLFSTSGGKIFFVAPRRVPVGLAGRVPVKAIEAGQKLLGIAEPAIRTDKPRARLRDIEHRGVVTAAMVYDPLPIIDIFRRVDADTLLG